MKPTNVCLSKSEISALLSSDLLPDETASAEQHIAECEACRTTIESMIADSRWWNDAQESLAAFSSLARSEADSSHEAEPTSTEQMLSLLGPTDDPEKIGRIAEYEVIGIIGRGGMGVVFKAFDPRLNRFVAIKMLLPHLAASGAARKRFAREGQAAAAVVDDYVLPIYAVSEWKGVPYLVTQYSRGTTLQKRVQSEGPLEVKEILRLGMQTARGLAAAHAQGLVHRDVKPSNILLDGSVERAMLTDFGLARAVDDASITRTGVIAGTPQYMSPEQARGGSVDARSDLFSLGCVLYFLCTGHPPFRADNSYAILRLITDEEPRSIREINPDVPAWLCSIVQKLMAKGAEDRYGSASEVADVLEECLAHVSNPLKNPLPVEPEALAKFAFSQPPSASRLGNRLAPQAQDRMAGASHSFLRFLWTAFMNDKRILSLVAFGLFLAAFLLPWPIAAIGRDEYAMIFAGVSMLLALSFAVMSRRESFSRIVLVTVGGVLGLLLVGVLISVPIFFWRGHAAENESLRAVNDAIVSEARAMQAAQNDTMAESWKSRTEIGQQDSAILQRNSEKPDQLSASGLIASDDPTVERVLARKTNLSALNVVKGSENEPCLQVEWAVGEGISWLFSESPLRREKLGSYPYCFLLSPNSTSNVPMINEQDLRIKSSFTMECEDTDDRFWDNIRGKKIEVPVTREDFAFVANGGTINMVLYLPENQGVFGESIDTVKSAKPEAEVLKTAKELGQPVISVVLKPFGIARGGDGGEGDLFPESNSTPKSSSQSTLAEAVTAFNKQSAIDRRTLFNPPIPDMTEEQLRQGFADAAKEYRDGGESHIADTLQKISETGVISTDGSVGVVLAGGIENPFQKDGKRHNDGKPETKQIVPALVLPDGTGGHKYVVLRPLELIYNHNGQSSKAYGALHGNQEHSPKKTVTVEIPLDISKHPKEMLEKNLNYQGLSLYAAGVMARAEGSDASAPATVVIAHDCILRAFEEVDRTGEKFWNTTLVVPMQNELLDLRPGMTLEEAEAKFDPKAFQDRLDKWRTDGAKFELDHYLGQEPTPSPQQGQVQPETEKTDNQETAVPPDETPKEMRGDDDTTGADGQEGNEANQVATTPVQADVASANSEVPESAASANPDAARFLGEWRLAHTFHHTTLPATAPCVISPASIVIGSSEDHGAHKFSFTLRGEQEIDLRLFGQDGLSAPLLGRYQFQESRLFIAFNNSPDAKERPQNATTEDPAKDVALMIFEFVATIDEDAAAVSGQ